MCICAHSRRCMRTCMCMWVDGRGRVVVRVWPYLFHMQCAAILVFAVSLAPPYFSTLSHKRNDFRKKVNGREMCILIFSTTFICNISHSKKNSARYCRKSENVFMYSTRYSCQILIKLEFSGQSFEKITNIIYHPMSCSVWTDRRQTDMTKQLLDFRNFAYVPNN